MNLQQGKEKSSLKSFTIQSLALFMCLKADHFSQITAQIFRSPKS